MKLAEHIRLGAMLKPQCFHGLWDGIGSCALGAAYDAAGITEAQLHPDHVYAAFPVLRHWPNAGPPFDCPVCSIQANPMGMIAHLNDDHLWSRELIADLVEQWEKELETSEPVAAGDPVEPQCEVIQ